MLLHYLAKCFTTAAYSWKSEVDQLYAVVTSALKSGMCTAVRWYSNAINVRIKTRQVSAAADRPARRSASGSPYCTQMSTISVINCDRDRHQFTTLTVQLS